MVSFHKGCVTETGNVPRPPPPFFSCFFFFCCCCCRNAIKYLEEARQKLKQNPAVFLEEDPILCHLLENDNLSATEKNLLVTEMFQGGIDAVIIFGRNNV